MTKIVLDSELLNKAYDSEEITREEAYHLYKQAEKNPFEIYKAAGKIRDLTKGKTVTYSRKAFLNLINLCRDTCSYCTYKSEPSDPKISMMSKEGVEELVKLAKKYKCTEALFVTGERPEQRYDEAKEWLEKNGFRSTVDFLLYASEVALKEGLFPHTNAGNLTRDEMSRLKKTNVSLGIMLENVSDRLSEKGMPHEFAPSKRPKARMHTLEVAGKLAIPMTTGVLIGIGETPFELIDSIFAIKSIHQRYRNIQEIILQNFQPKPATMMQDYPSPDETYFKIIVALTRLIMPEMNIQIPPNLSPRSYAEFLGIGINDWGGISPLTPDYVNPEFSWPSISTVKKHCLQAGFDLKARFPVYPGFLDMINKELKAKMLESADSNGLVDERWFR